jgi:hypothetical protein
VLAIVLHHVARILVIAAIIQFSALVILGRDVVGSPPLRPGVLLAADVVSVVDWVDRLVIAVVGWCRRGFAPQ